MAFIRTKKIKNAEYAYIVENCWKKSSVKQKSKQYLGKVYRFEKIQDLTFSEAYKLSDINEYAEKNSRRTILKDLIRIELLNHGFTEQNGEFVNGEVIAGFGRVVNSKGNPAAVAMNEGFLTGYGIRKIMNFKGVCSEDGYELAKIFVEAGLIVPKELFIQFFTKGI